MNLTRKQNHLKRLLQEYVAVLNSSNLEELSEVTMSTIDDNGDFNGIKGNILSQLMEEATTHYSEELKDLVNNKDCYNISMQQLIDNSYCKDWF